ADITLEFPVQGRPPPLHKGGNWRWPLFLPFAFAMLPIRPVSLGAGVSESIEDERIKPPLLFCKPESVIVNPWKQLETQQFRLVRTIHSFRKARTTLSQNCFEPGRSTAFQFNNGASPKRECLPPDIFLVCFVEAIPGNLHQLPTGSPTGNVPDPSFELSELRCLHLMNCPSQQPFLRAGTEGRELPEATGNRSQVQVGQRRRVAARERKSTAFFLLVFISKISLGEPATRRC